jgi:hypothetical protein
MKSANKVGSIEFDSLISGGVKIPTFVKAEAEKCQKK